MKVIKKVIVKVQKYEVPDTVLRIIDELEDYRTADTDNEYPNIIYRIETVKDLINNALYNTDETRKEAKQFVKQLGKTDYVMIVEN